MKVVICANGKGGRWNNYLGVKKQMIPIDGEPLLHRTVRLLKQFGVSNILISASDPDFEIEGTTRFTPKRNTWLIDQHPTECLNEPCLFVLGDVYWTENALRKTLEITPERFAFFHTINPVNNWEEEVAVKAVDYEGFKAGVKEYRQDLFKGMAKDLGGYELRMKLLGLPYAECYKNHDLVVWLDPDETCDFDWPEDYDRWMAKFRPDQKE